MQSRIEKITISVNDKYFELTPEEAKSLKKALCEIFSDPVVHFPQYYPWWVEEPYKKYYITSSTSPLKSKLITILNSLTSNTFPKEID